MSEGRRHDGAAARTTGGGDFTPSADAQQMADALRSSLAVRHRLAAESEGDDGARLRDLGDLEGLPAVAKPGIAAPAVRFARKVLQMFMRPWLAAQTIFNREVARRFQSIRTVVHDLERRTPHLESGLHHLEDRILALERELNPERGARGEMRREVGTNGIERMFVHSRLPAPPARVLLLGSSASAIAPELRSFGFEVAAMDAESDPVPGNGPLPFGESEFDVAVCLMASSSARSQPERGERLAVEAGRVLRAGGRLLLTLRSARNASSTGESAVVSTEAEGPLLQLRPLEIAEMLAQSDANSSLEVIVPAQGSPEPIPPRGAWFIDARRVDAPRH